jgi:small subunit ribosomal protein S9
MAHREAIYAPLRVTGQALGWDVWATVKGGGYSGQALAIQHGIAQAVQSFDIENYRPALKRLKYLTIDTRLAYVFLA